MATKIQLQSTIDDYKKSEEQYRQKWEQEKERANRLQMLLNDQFPELEHKSANENWNAQTNRWHRNKPKRDAVEYQFRRVLEWAGRNLGYGDNEWEKQATGLGVLVYLGTVEPELAIRFAAEVCEQHNYHGECARLMELYEEVTQPYARSHAEAQTVNWWAD